MTTTAATSLATVQAPRRQTALWAVPLVMLVSIAVKVVLVMQLLSHGGSTLDLPGTIAASVLFSVATTFALVAWRKRQAKG